MANELACIEHTQIQGARDDVVRLDCQIAKERKADPLSPYLAGLMEERTAARLRRETAEDDYRALVNQQAYWARRHDS